MDIADEIVESLALGDHTSLDRLAVRGLVGLGVVASGFLRSSARVDVGDPEVIHLVANPVAHGSRLAQAVKQSLTGMRVSRVSDARLAADPVDVNVAGLSPRSMLAGVSRQAVLQAIRLRKSAGWGVIRALSSNRIYAEYLFLAQSIRYATAVEALANVPDRTLVLTDFDRSAYSRPWIWAANKRGLRTLTMVHGSPNENYVPVLAETILAWGQVQADWFAIHSPGTHVEIVGRPDIPDEKLKPRAAPDWPHFITMEDIRSNFG